MAATTISGYSDALTQYNTANSALLEPGEQGGRVRRSFFTLTLASQASGTSFAVAFIPKGAWISAGVLAASATLANSATLAVGLAGKDGNGNLDDAIAGGPGIKPDGSAVTTGTAVSDSTTCLKAAAAQGATQVPFAITSALGFGYKTAKDLWLTLTTGTGTVSTEVVRGYVDYVID